jgi:hypothetical protein
MKNNLKLMDEIKIKILFFKIVKKKKRLAGLLAWVLAS